MLTYIYFPNSISQSFIVCSICILLSLGGIFLIRRIWPQSVRQQFGEIHGHIFGTIGVIYAVLIGAIAIGSWDKFKQVDQLAFEEAAIVVNIFKTAPGLGVKGEKDIKDYMQSYLINVIASEWPTLQKGNSQEIEEFHLNKMSNYLTAIHPQDKSQEIFLPIIVEETNKLREIREKRIFFSKSSINLIVFEFSLIGGFIVILAGILLTVEFPLIGSITITSLLAILIGLLISLIIGLDHPYQGNISVSADPFKQALRQIQMIKSKH